METLETARLVLRPFTLADVEDSYQMNLQSEVTRFTADGGVQPRSEIERRIREHVLADYEQYGYGRHAVVHKADQRFIGFSGLKYLAESDENDLGYRLLPQYWGQGLATESAVASLGFGFDTLRLTKIAGLVLPENKASVRVLEKSGLEFAESFQEDGRLVAKYEITVDQWRNRTTGAV